MTGKGFLITFEGIDGAGKSTIVSRLKALSASVSSLQQSSASSSNLDFLKNAVFTREPSQETLTGKAVYAAIASDVDPLAELFLFVADHAAHIADVIRPNMDAGKIVISDRYSDSRYAYQGATLASVIPNDSAKYENSAKGSMHAASGSSGKTVSDSENALNFVRKVHDPWTIVPDLTFIFDLDPEISVARCGDRGEKTKFEKTTFLTTVRENFEIIRKSEPERFCVIDATKSPDEIEKIVLERIEKLVSERI